MIDRIEHNEENPAVHVDRGRKEIRTVVQFKKRNRVVSNCTYCMSVHTQARLVSFPGSCSAFVV